MVTARTCPDIAQLKQLAIGELSSPDAEAMLDHLESCDVCVQRVEKLSEKDTLVDLIREARTLGDGSAGVSVAQLVERIRALRPDSAAGKAPESDRISNHATATGEDKTIAPKNLASVASPADIDRTLIEFLAPPQSADELGRLGPYRILKVLGAGGMGVVFQAEDPHLQRIVALKAMLPGLAASASAKERFLREARAAAKLKHDHVVTIHQVGEDRGAPYLAMEFLDGEPLDERLKRAGTLPAAEVLRIGREMAEGLAAAHERGLIHRDIKPANVWLEGKKGRVKILDFGLARASTEEAQLTQSGAIVGTPAYMAPEQAQGRNVDPRCDLFSLGCVLYRMATGETPFKGTDVISTLMAVSTHDPAAPITLNNNVPMELSDLIMQLLAKNPQDRPVSAQAVSAALEQISRDPPTELMARPSATPPSARAGSRLLLVITAAVVALAVALGTGVWLSGILVRVESKNGTLIIKSDDPTAAVKITADGGATVTYGKDQRTIPLKPGKYGIELAEAKDGLQLSMTQFTIASDANKTIEVFWEKKATPPDKGVEPAPPTARFIAPDYAEIHDAEPQRFDDWIKQMQATGYRPITLTLRAAKDGERYTSVAIKEEKQIGWLFTRCLDEDQKHVDDLWQKNYALEACCLYHKDGKVQNAILWSLGTPDRTEWVWSGDADFVQKKIGKNKKRVLSRTAVVVDGAPIFCVILCPPDATVWSESFNQSLDAMKVWIAQQKALERRPDRLYTYGSGPNTLFGSLVHQDANVVDWEISWSLTPAQYEAELISRKKLGFRPHSPTAHEDDAGALRFSVIWLRFPLAAAVQ